jgi:prevent-host-death family protein
VFVVNALQREGTLKTISAREANQSFSKLLAEVAAGNEVVITRRGRPVAKLSPYVEMSPERAVAAERLMSRLRRGARLGGARVNRDEIYER